MEVGAYRAGRLGGSRGKPPRRQTSAAVKGNARSRPPPAAAHTWQTASIAARRASGPPPPAGHAASSVRRTELVSQVRVTRGATPPPARSRSCSRSGWGVGFWCEGGRAEGLLRSGGRAVRAWPVWAPLRAAPCARSPLRHRRTPGCHRAPAAARFPADRPCPGNPAACTHLFATAAAPLLLPVLPQHVGDERRHRLLAALRSGVARRRRRRGGRRVAQAARIGVRRRRGAARHAAAAGGGARCGARVVVRSRCRRERKCAFADSAAAAAPPMQVGAAQWKHGATASALVVRCRRLHKASRSKRMTSSEWIAPNGHN